MNIQFVKALSIWYSNKWISGLHGVSTLQAGFVVFYETNFNLITPLTDPMDYI